MSDTELGFEDLLDVPEVADILHVSSKTVARLIGDGQGELPAIKVGSRWKVLRKDVKEYLQKGSTESANNTQTIDTIVDMRTQKDTNTENVNAMYEALLREHFAHQPIAQVYETIFREHLAHQPEADVLAILNENADRSGAMKKSQERDMLWCTAQVLLEQVKEGFLASSKSANSQSQRKALLEELTRTRNRVMHNQKTSDELEKQRELLSLERERLELQEKRLALANSAIEIATKIVNALHPNAVAETKAMFIGTLIPNLLQLDDSKGLELVIQDVSSNS